MNRDRITQNPDRSDGAQRDRTFCRRLLPALREGAESEDDRVAPLAIRLIVHAVAQHVEAATFGGGVR